MSKSKRPVKSPEQLKSIVVGIISELRRGRSAELPGLGRFIPGERPAFEFENAKKQSDAGPKR